MKRSIELTVLAVALSGFSAVAWWVGPLTINDEPLDLGAGISMSPSGEVWIHDARLPWPMRLPDEREYSGEPAATELRQAQHVGPPRAGEAGK